MLVNSEFFLGAVSLVLTLVIAVLGWKMQRKTEQIKIMQNQLSDKKYSAYADLVGLFFGVLKDVKNERISNPEVLRDRIMESKKDVFMYGSDNVIKAFNTWLCYTKENANNLQMAAFLDLMIEIRKDMCGNSSKISQKDLLLTLVQDQKDVESFFMKL